MTINMWCIYIVECADGSYYTGISNNVLKRIDMHNAGRGAKYTRTRRPVKLVYTEGYNDRIEAMKREFSIKRLSLSSKRDLFQLS